MRFLLVLLAMLSGLSLSNLAVASSRAEVADMGSTVLASAQSPQRGEACVASGAVARRTAPVERRKRLWLPLPAFVRACSIILTDRPRT